MSAGWARLLFVGFVARSAIDDCFSLATIGRPEPQYDVLEKTQALMFLKSMLAMFNTKHKCLIFASANSLPPPAFSLNFQHPPALPSPQRFSPKARTNLWFLGVILSGGELLTSLGCGMIV